MVRKQTWIVLAIFVVLLGAAFYLQKNPLPKDEALTPSPTASPRLLEGWQGSEIVWMEMKDGQENVIQLVQNDQGSWALGMDGKDAVEMGLAEQIRTEIVEMRTIAALPGDYQLGAIGLDSPASVLTVRSQQGKQAAVKVGNTDPTGRGYYVQVDTQAPVVVDQYTLSGILDLFNNALPAPTTEPETPTETDNPLLPKQTPSP